MDENSNKILIITRDISYPGGTEYFLYDYLRYLSDHVKPKDIYLLEVEGSGKFVNSYLEVKLKEKGVNVINIPNNISKLEFWDPLKLSYFDNLVTQINPRIVHSFLFNADFVAYYLKTGRYECTNSINKAKKTLEFKRNYPEAFTNLPETKIHRYKWVSSKLNNFSVALEVESDAWIVRKEFIDNDLEPIVSRNSDVITVVSNEGIRKWSNWLVKPPILIPCSAVGKGDLVSIDRLISKTRITTQSQTIRFICVSRLVLGKGIEDLVETFKSILSRGLDIELTIVGDGDLIDSIKASTFGIPQIKIMGFKSREEVFKILAKSDIFILASHSEGLPLSIQEAMAFGLPIVATNIGGIPDLVSDHKNGVLFSPGDTAGLTKCILELSQSSETRKQMGKLSRKKLEKSFLKEKSYDSLFEQYSLP